MNQFILFVLCLAFIAPITSGRKLDVMHHSIVFNEDRTFRIYLPWNYDSSGTTRYPVIYYCHGCGGSYQGEKYTAYWEGGYTHPYYCDTYADTACDPALNKPFNADFQMFADSHAVLVVMLDGHINGLTDGCNNYYPYQSNPGWTKNDYDFPLYFRELFHAVDSLFPTRALPQYRAISGLSMGGYASLWIASQNPHNIRSVSHFCFSPIYFKLGRPPYLTVCAAPQFWRNFRGVATRTSANNQDYLYQYSQELGSAYQGAGFQNQYHLATFFRHWAADVDSQFLFHLATFDSQRTAPPCFSFLNYHPSFDVWDYSVQSNKQEAGLIFLRDAAKNGLGVCTRRWPPYGSSMSEFPVTVTTAPLYQAGGAYRMVRYNYRAGAFSAGDIAADGAGRLSFTAAGGMGEEVGFSGSGLGPALTLLADTLCETVFLPDNQDTALTFCIANLSENAVNDVVIRTYSENSCVTVISGQKVISSIPAKSVLIIDSMAVVRGHYSVRDIDTSVDYYLPEYHNIGYLRVGFSVGGTKQDKEHILQVHVADSMPLIDSADVTIIDGRSVNLSMLTSSVDGAVQSRRITEGIGNGNGVADSGEVFSVWIRKAQGYSPSDANNWHPTVPMNGAAHPDVAFVSDSLYMFNRARQIVSGQIKLNRRPTPDNPMVIPVMTELLCTQLSPGSDKNVDSYIYRYGKIVLPLGTAIGVEKGGKRGGVYSLSMYPNPFNPVTRIRFGMPVEVRDQIRIDIYSVSGKRVRSFFPGQCKVSGQFGGYADWDAKDDDGKSLSAGVYMVRFHSPGFNRTIKTAYLP